MTRARSDTDRSVMLLGAAVSVIQSALFVAIGIAALVLGVDRLVEDGFASLLSSNSAAFRVLCTGFILIALLGLAITPAERALIEAQDPALARFGSTLAYLGHGGTIAFFAWWLLTSLHDSRTGGLDTIAPIDWGVMFELVFVGAWVWIIAFVIRSDRSWPRGFLALSVMKATSFWFAFAAFLADEPWMIVVGVGAVAFVTGPLWHVWISRILVRRSGALDVR